MPCMWVYVVSWYHHHNIIPIDNPFLYTIYLAKQHDYPTSVMTLAMGQYSLES